MPIEERILDAARLLFAGYVFVCVCGGRILFETRKEKMELSFLCVCVANSSDPSRWRVTRTEAVRQAAGGQTQM
jgi:hypothetical protein